jgi:hypothetical protein
MVGSQGRGKEPAGFFCNQRFVRDSLERGALFRARRASSRRHAGLLVPAQHGVGPAEIAYLGEMGF